MAILDPQALQVHSLKIGQAEQPGNHCFVFADDYGVGGGFAKGASAQALLCGDAQIQPESFLEFVIGIADFLKLKTIDRHGCTSFCARIMASAICSDARDYRLPSSRYISWSALPLTLTKPRASKR